MDWYKAVQTYTRDTAMGCAIGHTLELADRHLDNILINLREGNLVHVDFSILFGKGACLRVPECVPFRLTQNIVEALQYPGVNVSSLPVRPSFLLHSTNSEKFVFTCFNFRVLLRSTWINSYRNSMRRRKSRFSVSIALQWIHNWQKGYKSHRKSF